jgi:hypothetical protein
MVGTSAVVALFVRINDIVERVSQRIKRTGDHRGAGHHGSLGGIKINKCGW